MSDSKVATAFYGVVLLGVVSGLLASLALFGTPNVSIVVATAGVWGAAHHPVEFAIAGMAVVSCFGMAATRLRDEHN